MRWDDLDRHQPRLADRARKRLVDPGIALVVTIGRRDGTPRLSPVEPFVLDGRLWLSMMWQSWKARDLLRDPRVLVHGIVTDRDGADGEVKVRGAARAENDRRRFAATPTPSARPSVGSPRSAGSICSRWTSRT